MRASLLCLLVVTLCCAGRAGAMDTMMPFAREIQMLSTQQPRRAQHSDEVHRPGFAQSAPQTADAAQRAKMHSESIRHGGVVPPLIEFIGGIDSSFSMPSTSTGQAGNWLMRGYQPRMGIPDADVMPNLNMRLPTPF